MTTLTHYMLSHSMVGSLGFDFIDAMAAVGVFSETFLKDEKDNEGKSKEFQVNYLYFPVPSHSGVCLKGIVIQITPIECAIYCCDGLKTYSDHRVRNVNASVTAVFKEMFNRASDGTEPGFKEELFSGKLFATQKRMEIGLASLESEKAIKEIILDYAKDFGAPDCRGRDYSHVIESLNHVSKRSGCMKK